LLLALPDPGKSGLRLVQLVFVLLSAVTHLRVLPLLEDALVLPIHHLSGHFLLQLAGGN